MAQLETKVDNVDNDVVSFNWKFLGHGCPPTARESFYKHTTTLQECIEVCIKKRKDSGGAWNDLRWRQPNGECGCFENGTGHIENANDFHFRV